ncbi:MAG: endo-1,4-beta-xylanase, partial [Anaerolineae bacterium]|nr:endo-1,4-beta-xylanase [Anaerolineae bacterium]
MFAVKKLFWVMVLVLIASLIMVGCSSPEPTPVPTELPAAEPTEEPTTEPTVEPTGVPTVEVEATAVPVVEISEPESDMYNFEDGTMQGWGAYGETAVSVSTASANSGANSLLVAERAAVKDGAAVDLTGLLEPGKPYKISGYARVVDGEPESQFVLTMKRTPAGETAVSEWVASSPLFGTDDPDWVRLSGEYSFTGNVDELLLVVASPASELVDFYIDDVTVAEVIDPNAVAIMAPQSDIPSLHETFTDQFLVGAAIEPYQLDSEYHADLLTRHFNIVTPENVMKPISIQPREGEFTWDEADKLVAFARENGLAVHGHTLVWHQQVPDWMFQDEAGKPLEPSPESKALVLQRLETHIRAITERYQDDIVLWDVVNEVIDTSEEDCMRHSPWYELTGTDYIATAFRVADEMLPNTSLILNDYGTTDPAKQDCIYNLVQTMQADGVPIDGIGMQMHVNIENPSAYATEQTIERFAELGEVHITEMDMSLYTNDTDSYSEVPEDLLVKQGYRYKALFEVFARQADKIDTVTFWGMADDHTWLKTWPIDRINLPLPFDEALQAKYAYWGIIDPDQLPVFTQVLESSQGTPEIDGMTETVWAAQAGINLQASDSLTTSFKTSWDAETLYLFVETQGGTADGETVDLFIDMNNGKTAVYEGDELHLTFQDGVCA